MVHDTQTNRERMESSMDGRQDGGVTGNMQSSMHETRMTSSWLLFCLGHNVRTRWKVKA